MHNAHFVRIIGYHMDSLLRRSQVRINQINTSITRELMGQIDWSQRLIAIKGTRGVGKTTMLLQHIKLNRELNESVAFINLDDLYFADHKLTEFIESFVMYGGKYLYLDEVHKYDNWSIEIKNAYDYYPELYMVFTGSSIIQILNAQADLSRRAVIYHMQGLSFREYLAFTQGKAFRTYSLSDLLDNHLTIASEIVKQLKPLAAFQDYLRHGYYPYFLEGTAVYGVKLNQTIKMILEVDLKYLEGYNVTHATKIAKLLYAISSSVPFKPNISKLSERIGLNRNILVHYFHYLESAQLVSLLSTPQKGISMLQKPDKVYLENTNLLFAIAENNTELGHVRETFVFNQLKYQHGVSLPTKGDFLVDDYLTIEVGGKNKKATQVKHLKDYLIASDGIEIGRGRQIPLWLFGFLY